MRIDKIRINSFGKLVNFTLELGEGLNIILGNNEDGKSTIMAFIKMAFYGTEGKSSDILKNQRKKYFPWSGNPASGSIEFTYNNQQYRLDKLFGATNSSDKTDIINLSTGEKFQLGNKVAGEVFFGFSLATFEKSVYIAQPGTFVDGKIDEINSRLSNMITTADESISYDKVKTEIDNQVFALKSKSGKIGILDILNKNIKELNDSLSDAREIERENKELEEIIIIKEQEVLRLETAYNEKQKQQENFDIIRKYNTLLSIKNLADEVKELKSDLKEQEVILKRGNFIANVDFIDENEVLLTQCENLFSQIKDYKKRLKLSTQENSLPENFPDEDEFILIQEKDKQFQELKHEVDALEQKISTTGRSDLGISEDKIRFAKENHLRITRQMDAEVQRFESMHALEKKPKRQFGFFTFFLGIILIGLSIYLGLTQNTLFHYGIVLGFVVFIFPILNFMLKGNPKKQTKEKQIEDIKESYKDDLNKAKSELSQSEYEYENIMLEQKQKLVNLNAQHEELLKKYNKEQAELKALIEPFNCDSAEELLNIYVKTQSKINTVKGARAEVEQNLSNAKEQLETLTKQLYKAISPYTKAQSIDEIKKTLNTLKKSSQIYSVISAELKTKEEILTKNLKGLTLDKIEMGVKSFQEKLGNKAFSYDESDEEFESKLNSEVYRLRSMYENENNELVKMKAELTAKYQNSPKIASIQDEIEEKLEKSRELNKVYAALTIAQDVLEESHSEMRQNYTPLLNEKASKILSKLTGGKYKDIKINRTLDVNIEDDTTGFFREWQYLSTGTIDQAYLSVQLTLASIFSDDEMVQFLDDSFVHYDDERTRMAMEFLQDYAKSRQVVLFTCKSREADFGEKFGIVHDIR